MRGRKLQTLLCAALLGVSLWLPGQVSAEVRTVEADGFYQMGDGMAENQAIAKERARVDAIRSAGEQAATYVESFTAVSNSKVTKDDIRLWTSSVLEVRDVKFTPVVVGESIQFQCHVVAVVDTDKVKEKIQEDNINLKHSLQKYQEENERLRKEMEEFKQQYKTATPEQKKKIDIEAQKNDREYEANSYFEKGGESIQKKDYISAIDYLEKAISLKPDYAEAYKNIGYVYNELGEYQKAIENLEKAISLKPDYAEAYCELAVCYKNLGNIEKANEYYEKACSLDSKLRNKPI